jgi:hypothetical protein
VTCRRCQHSEARACCRQTGAQEVPESTPGEVGYPGKALAPTTSPMTWVQNFQAPPPTYLHTTTCISTSLHTHIPRGWPPPASHVYPACYGGSLYQLAPSLITACDCYPPGTSLEDNTGILQFNGLPCFHPTRGRVDHTPAPQEPAIQAEQEGRHDLGRLQQANAGKHQSNTA